MRLYGPLSGYGTWAFERHNGLLSSVNNNKQVSDIPMTMMRHWLLNSRLRALATNPADNATSFEGAQLAHLLKKAEDVRGTLMLQESTRSRVQPRMIGKVSRYGTCPNLEHDDLRAYEPLLAYVTRHHPQYGLRAYTHFLSSSMLLPPR